jgi:hypothetical protein
VVYGLGVFAFCFYGLSSYFFVFMEKRLFLAHLSLDELYRMIKVELVVGY